MYFAEESHFKQGTMGRKKVHGQLIAVRIMPESYIPQCLNMEQLNKGKVIGAVLIPIEGTTCFQVRQTIKKFLDVPKEFCFLSSAGWPFDSSLEDKILIVDCLTNNVVTIQRKHPKFSRIGIKLLEGPVLGFIYLKFSYEIAHVRNLIISELSDKFEGHETFQFFDSNSWPVRRKQESELSIWDLVDNNCITIIKTQIKRDFEDEEINVRKKFKKTIDIMPTVNHFNSHSILISYVHREAKPYAQELKNTLKKLGFDDIFLDVDDIPAGGDWQDVISKAVNRCSIFIPLVTSSYGETRWTNREAKLADDREKLIIPISFVDKWPPDQLAIQFLTLQYIPWKSSDETDGGNFSGHSDTTWNHKNVLRVANEIKRLCSNNEILTPDSVSLLDGRQEKPITPLKFALNLNGKSKKKIATEKIFIVISAHSKQLKFVNEKVTPMLESQGYIVWNSVNLCDCDENSFSPIEDTHPLNSPLNTPLIENSYAISTLGHSASNAKSLKCTFKEKVKLAKLVVLVFSEEYIKSSICRQQAFYCEQRKKNIVIKYGDYQVDSLLLNLYPEQEMIPMEHWECLKYKIRDKLNFDYETSYWNNVNIMVSKLKKDINTNMALYIIGASRKMTKGVEEFCRNLGYELAKVPNLNIATEGSKGVGDIVGRNFCEEQEIMNKNQAPRVFHIIPDVPNISNNLDMPPYGKTLPYGVSAANRDDIVASAFKLCLLIAGGESAAYLAEKFLFNDCTVIPVLQSYTTKCLKDNLTKVPDNIDERDWLRLNKHITHEERAKTVKNIICDVLNISQ